MSEPMRGFRFAVTVTEGEISVSVCDRVELKWCLVRPVDRAVLDALLLVERTIHALPTTMKPTDSWRRERDEEMARVLEGMTARSADG